MAPKTMLPSALPKLRPNQESESAAAVTQNKKAAARARNAAESSAAIATIIERLRELSERKGRSKWQLIRDHVELGQELIRLKLKAGPGKWAHYRDQAGFGETKALFLMKLAKSWLAVEILTNGKDLMGIPTDIQKLAKLVDLSRAQVQELIVLQDFDDMTRKKVRDVVDAKTSASKVPRKADNAAVAAETAGAQNSTDQQTKVTNASGAQVGHADDDTGEDQEADAAEDEFDQSLACFVPGSPEELAINAAAQAIQKLVVNEARKSLSGPAFIKLRRNGCDDDSLTQLVILRACALLTK